MGEGEPEGVREDFAVLCEKVDAYQAGIGEESAEAVLFFEKIHGAMNLLNERPLLERGRLYRSLRERVAEFIEAYPEQQL